MTEEYYLVITDYYLYFYIDLYSDWEFLTSSELLYVATVVTVLLLLLFL